MSCFFPKHKTSFYDLKLCTGTLVFFKKPLRKAKTFVIAATTRSRYTHVGVVMDLTGLYKDCNLFLLESDYMFHDDLKDYLTMSTVTTGTRLVSLEERLKYFLGDPRNDVRICTPDVAMTEIDEAYNFCLKHKNKGYENSLAQIMNCVLPFKLTNGTDERLFCSELVVEFLKSQDENLEIDASTVSPGDLVNGRVQEVFIKDEGLIFIS